MNSKNSTQLFSSSKTSRKIHRDILSRPAKPLTGSVATLLAAAAFSGGFSPLAQAATVTWTGSTGGDWSTPGNWSALPGAADTAIFSTSLASILNASGTDQSVGSLSFDTGAGQASGSFTIGTTGGNKLILGNSGTTQILSTLAGNGKAIGINAPLVLTPASTSTSGTYTFANNSVDPTNTLSFGGAISASTTSGTETLILTGLNTGNNTISGNISNGAAAAVAVTKTGAGKWVLSGSNTYTGQTTLQSGALTLDFSAAGAPSANTLPAVTNTGSSPYGLFMAATSYNTISQSPMLTLIGSSGTLSTQTFAGVYASSGASHINLVPGASGTLSVRLGYLGLGFNNQPGSLDINLPANATATTTNPNNSYGTITMGGATIGGTTWAVSGVTSIAGVASLSGSNVFTCSSGAPADGTQVTLTTSPLASGSLAVLTANATYYVLNSGASTTRFQLAAPPGGTPLTLLSSTNTGTVYKEGAISGLTSFATAVSGSFSVVNSNIDVTTNGSLMVTTNTIRFNNLAANTLTIPDTATIRSVVSGGILVTANVGPNVSTISGGFLSTASRRYLGFIQNNTAAPLEVDSQIVDYGGTGGMGKSGAGTLILTGVNTFRGNAEIAEGTTIVTGNGIAGVTLTGTAATGSNTLSMPDTTGVFVGEWVTGTANLTTSNYSWLVTAVTTNSVTLTGTASVTGTGSFVFGGGGGLGTAPAATQPGAILQLGNGGTTGSLIPGQTINNYGTVAFNRSNTLIADGQITQSGGVSQIGSGCTIFTVTNTYTGPTTINSGTLQVGNGGTTGLIASSSAISGSTGATLVFNRSDSPTYSNTISGGLGVTQAGSGSTILTGSNSYTGPTTINSGTLQIGSSGTTGSISNSSTVSGSTGATLAIKRSDAITFANTISGGLGVVQSGAGSTALTGSNSYTGPTTLSSGTLIVGVTNNLGGPASNLVFDGGTLQLTGTALTSFSGLGHSVSFNAGKAVGLDIVGSSNIFTADQALNQTTGSFTKLGAGTLILTGSNSYTGATAVSGTLQIGNGTSGSISSSGAVTVNTGATLVLNLANNGIFGNAVTTFGGVTINAIATGTNTISGSISGAGGLNQSGSGLTILSANASYAGPTNITNGALQLNGTNAAYLSTVNVGVDNGLAFGGNTAALGALAGSGNVVLLNGASPVALTVGGNNADSLYSGILSGAGSLIKSGTGALSLTNANSYSGATTVSAGTLILKNQNAIQNSTLTPSSGTIAFDSSVSGNAFTVGGLAGSGSLVLQNNAATPAPVVLSVGNNNVTSAYTGILSGSGSIRKIGSGMASFNSSSTYTGGFELVSGTLSYYTNPTATGGAITASAFGTGTLTIDDGASISWGGNCALGANQIDLGTSPSTVNFGSGVARLSFAGPLLLHGQTHTFNIPGSTAALSAGIAGAASSLGLVLASVTNGPVASVDSGTLKVVGSGPWAGFACNTTVNFANNAGLEIGNNILTSFYNTNSLGTGTNAPNLTIDAGGYFSMTRSDVSASQTVNSLSGAGIVTDLGTVSGTATLTISGSSNTTFSGQILDGPNLNTLTGIASQGIVALTKSGGGILTLSGSNSYSGLTTISSGTLLLANANALGTGNLTASGGTVDLGGFNPTVGAVSITAVGTAIQNGGIAGTSYAASNTSGIAVIPGNLLSNGAAGLTKTGAGTLSLTGSNSYTGTTAINAGILSLGSATALAGGGVISFGGGTLQFSSNNHVDYSTSILNSGSAIVIDTNGQPITFASPLDGTNVGGLTKSGSGTLGISGLNNYGGATTITGGTLQLANGTTLGSGTGNLTVNAGTLDLNGNSIFVGSLSGSTGVNITNTSLAAAVLTASSSASSTFAGLINDGSGGMAVIKAGTGVLTLTGSNLFSGGLTIAAGSVVTGSNGRAFGSGTITIGDSSGTANASLETVGNTGGALATFSNSITVAAGSSGTATLKSNNGTWNYTGSILLNKDLTISNTALGGGSNPMTLSGNVTGSGNLIANSAGLGSIFLSGSSINNTGTITNVGNLSFAGVGLTISGNIGSNVSGIVQSGSTTMLLTGSNSYGETTIASGTLQVGNGGSIGTLGTGVVTNNDTLAFNRTDFAFVVANDINGTGGLAQIGTGVTTLSGSNSYTGATSVTNGVLVFANSNALSAGSAVSATAPGAIGLAVGAGAYGTSDVDALFANTMPGVTLGAGASVGIDTTAGDWVYVTTQTATRPLTKVGANTLALTGSNTFTGVTILGGALDLGGTTQSVGALSVTAPAATGDTIFNGSLSGISYAVSNATGTVTLSANLLANGSSGLTKSGSGTLVLTGSNTYTGATVINGGTVQIGNGGTVGTLAGSSAISGSAGGKLVFMHSDSLSQGVDFAGFVSGGISLVQAGAGTLTLSASNTYSGGTIINSGGTVVVSNSSGLGTGGVTNNGTLNLTATPISNSSINYTGLSTSLSGSGTVNVTLGTGQGATNLTGNYSAFTGTFNIGVGAASASGKASLTGADNALATINVLTNATDAPSSGTHYATLYLNGGDTGESYGQLRVDNATWAGNIILAGPITGAGDGFIGAWNTSVGTISGVISEINGSQNLSKVGSATVILTGSDTYSGGTTITGGTLQIGNGGATGILGSGNVTDNASLVFKRGDTMTVSNNVAGTGAVWQSGSGSLILTGSNTYSGGTTIASGSLQVGSANALGTGNLTASGGTLDLGGFSPTVGAVSITSGASLIQNGSLSGTSYAVSNATGNVIVSANLLANGSAGLTKTGAGTLTLTGLNTFTEPVLIQAGVVSASFIGMAGAPGNLGAALQTSGSLNSPIIIYNTGVLNYTGTGETTDRNVMLYDGDNRTMTISANGSGALNLSGTITNRYANATPQAEWFALTGASTNANTISGAITEGGWGNHVGLSKQGAGTWALSGTSNTYQAVTDVENGILQFASIANAGTACALGAGSANKSWGFIPSVGQTTSGNSPGLVPYQISLGSGSTAGVLQYTGTADGSSNRQVGLNGNGTLSTAAAAGNLTLSGTIAPVASTNVTLTLDANNDGTNTVSGVIADLAGASTTVSTSGSNNAGYVNVASTAGFSIGQTLSTGTGLAANAVIMGITSGTLYVFPNTSGTVVNGATISAGGAQMSVTKSGTGVWTLSGANTYSGATTINAGTLKISAASNLGDSTQASNTIALGAAILESTANTYDLGVNRTITLTGPGTLQSDAGTLTISGTVNNGGNGLTVAGAGNVTLSGTVAGSGGLSKTGVGTLTLLAANTYTGATSINAGTLQLGNSNALSAGGLSVNGGTLDLHGNSIAVQGLSGSTGALITNSVSGTGTLAATVSTGTSSYSGDIVNETGSVVLTKSGAGKLILSGSLTMAGLNANGGVTELTQSSSIGTISVAAGGAMTLTAHTGGNAYKVLDTNSLSITAGGNIDLWNNAMILRASGTSENAANLTAVKAAVNAASAGLQWSGTGIGSTTAFNEAQPGKTQALAVMVYDNSVIAQSSFEGVSGLGYFDGSNNLVGFNQVLVKLTYLGDFNADGVVNASDYTWLDGFALGANPLGDLNGDGVVNATDYTWLDGSALNQSFGVLAGQQNGSGVSPLAPAVASVPVGLGAIATPPESVPEPGALGLLLAGASALLGFRRNRRTP